MVSLALSGCGGGDDGPPQVHDSTSAVIAFAPDRRAPAAPIPHAVKGGTITVLSYSDLGRGPGWTDPTGSYWITSSSILSGLVTRSLTQYAYDPKSASMVLVPDLATDLGTPNADFTQWTFTIRDGVRFEDGSPVTAEDVAYGIKRSFDRRAFTGGATYSNDYFLDGHSYRGPYLSGTDYPGVVVDGNRVTIKMARPFPDMPYWGAFAAMGPIPARGSDPATYWRHPLATGPYKFAAYVPGKSLTLVRNGEWDPATDPGRHAYPDRYVFKFHQAIGRMESTILDGSAQGQTALSYDSVSVANSARAQRLERLTTGLAPCTRMLWADNRKITDVRVRRALGYAFPYRQVAAIVDDQFGLSALPGTSILPPGTPGRQVYSALHADQGQTRPHMAQMLLRRAGYAPGDYAITFAYSDAPGAAVDVAVKDQLVKSLHAAGFAAHPIGAATLDQLGGIQDDPHSPVNVRLEGWCADWPSGSSFLPHFFASNGDQNKAYFSVPEVDASIERISSLPLAQQPSEWGKLDEHIMKTYYPGVILYNTQVSMLHGSRIGGLNDDSSFGMPTWKDLYLSR